MNNPRLFVKTGIQAQCDFKYVSKEYINKLQFKEYCNVMDIGCGPGNITREVLLQLLPKTTNSLIGVDVSTEMVNYARKNYQTDPKLSFEELDILTDEIPQKHCVAFDHIFSFYCLHFMDNHRKALKNMNAMLKPNGTIFVYFMAKCVIFDVYRSLEVKDKWKPYLTNYKQQIPSPYPYECSEQFKNILKETNFTTNYCVSKERGLTYSKQDYIDIINTIKIPEIPQHLEEEFILENLNTLRHRNLFYTNELEEHILHPYTLLIAHATKSL